MDGTNPTTTEPRSNLLPGLLAIVGNMRAVPPERGLWRELVNLAIGPLTRFMSGGTEVSAAAVWSVAMTLYTRADAGGAIVGFPVRQLAADCRLSERCVKAALAVLVTLHVVKRQRGNRRKREPDGYRMNLGGLDWRAVRHRAKFAILGADPNPPENVPVNGWLTDMEIEGREQRRAEDAAASGGRLGAASAPKEGRLGADAAPPKGSRTEGSGTTGICTDGTEQPREGNARERAAALKRTGGYPATVKCEGCGWPFYPANGPDCPRCSRGDPVGEAAAASNAREAAWQAQFSASRGA